MGTLSLDKPVQGSNSLRVFKPSTDSTKTNHFSRQGWNSATPSSLVFLEGILKLINLSGSLVGANKRVEDILFMDWTKSDTFECRFVGTWRAFLFHMVLYLCCACARSSSKVSGKSFSYLIGGGAISTIISCGGRTQFRLVLNTTKGDRSFGCWGEVKLRSYLELLPVCSLLSQSLSCWSWRNCACLEHNLFCSIWDNLSLLLSTP